MGEAKIALFAKDRSAFTLLELLVVLAILGIAIISTMPRVAERAERGDPTAYFFKELLDEHLSYAKQMGLPVSFTGFKGGAQIEKYDGVRVSIPNVKSVQSAKVNLEFTPGLDYSVTVYPDGLCDYFELETNKGIIIASAPLLMTVRIKQNDR